MRNYLSDVQFLDGRASEMHDYSLENSFLKKSSLKYQACKKRSTFAETFDGYMNVFP